MEDSPTELSRQLVRDEDALEDFPPRAVLEHALVPARGLLALAQDRPDDDELERDATGLVQETLPLGLLEVALELAREQAVE